jgi:cell division protein FtsB
VRRAAWLLLVAVTAAGVLLLFVFPGRTLLDQSRDISVAEQHIHALDRENAVLRQRQAALQDPVQIEQIARERFGMVPIGQQGFAITQPPPAAPVASKATHKPARHWWQKLEFWR